jgi:lactosylceramide 4-alpha-galactosyltransferase
MCGRPNCLSPCPYPPLPEHKHLNVIQDKAFFHETSGATFLNFRQACVVESLAYHNPNLTVHLLMTGHQLDLNSLTMKTLRQNYPNVQITSINLGDYMVGTPLESWYFCTEWNRGWFAVAHLSDALRFLTLSKYGGYYFDLDVIQLRPVTSYRNFVVAEDDNKLGSSVIHVDHQHPVIMTAVETFATDYK